MMIQASRVGEIDVVITLFGQRYTELDGFDEVQFIEQVAANYRIFWTCVQVPRGERHTVVLVEQGYANREIILIGGVFGIEVIDLFAHCKLPQINLLLPNVRYYVFSTLRTNLVVTIRPVAIIRNSVRELHIDLVNRFCNTGMYLFPADVAKCFGHYGSLPNCSMYASILSAQSGHTKL